MNNSDISIVILLLKLPLNDSTRPLTLSSLLAPQFLTFTNFFPGGLIPGKLLASHGTAYVPWGGSENAVPEYEVLCDFNGTWIANSGSNIPPNAVAGGQSEEGEALYVGRVLHEGALTVGKVQPSHGVCYIPYGGQELGFPDYEILVS